ncbi:host attachment protein [Altererythrobacter sp. GH1-8]|uniref:baeRF12 domain-containing protein n=1 Tax=Altererythrobacter sp. GH1-8 TaxID=3349333 RepID=UPI00374CCFB2
MKLPYKAHVAVVDGENFILFRNDGQIFEPSLTHEARPALDTTNFSAGVRHQDHVGREIGRTQLDELAHGAAVAEWLNAKCIAGEIDHLLIIADPKTMGEMRHHYHTKLQEKLVGELAKTMTQETADRIAAAIQSE